MFMQRTRLEEPYMQVNDNIIRALPQDSLSPDAMLQAIHRAPGVYVPLFQKAQGSTIHHGAIKMATDTYPEQLEFQPDVYSTVNSYARCGRDRMPTTGLHYGLRRETFLSHLNALFIDFDTGRGDGIQWEDVAIELLKLQRDKVIPPFTMLATSGRGVYAVWLLHDPKTGEGLPATPANIRHYKNLNKALQALMPRWLKPDSAHDAARLLRISQTFNSKSGSPCQWFLVSGARYTLNEMEIRLRTGEQPRLELLPEYQPPGIRPIIERDMYPARRNGFEAVNMQRAQDIETIEQYRGGFLHGGWVYPDGHRSPGRRALLSLYCQYLYCYLSPVEVKERVRAMAARCTPPYPSDVSDVDLKNIFQGIFGKDKDAFFKNMPTAQLHGLLGVGTLPLDVQECLHTVKADAPVQSKAEQVKARQKALQDILREHDHVPPLRKLASMLHAHGIARPDGRPWGKNTLQRDLENIG